MAEQEQGGTEELALKEKDAPSPPLMAPRLKQRARLSLTQPRWKVKPALCSGTTTKDQASLPICAGPGVPHMWNDLRKVPGAMQTYMALLSACPILFCSLCLSPNPNFA